VKDGRGVRRKGRPRAANDQNSLEPGSGDPITTATCHSIVKKKRKIRTFERGKNEKQTGEKEKQFKENKKMYNVGMKGEKPSSVKKKKGEKKERGRGQIKNNLGRDLE